ncbi:hypothetical protein ABWH89_16195 [Hoeflea alexandrii]|uniref:hypothetical protein n=1 Tax=Hoeflea alexandrii TaxID=288436 RepID=UPI0035D00E74
MPYNVTFCSYRISPPRRLLFSFTAGATLSLSLALSAAEASTCSVLGAGTNVHSGSTTIQAVTLDPAKRHCLTGRTDVRIYNGTLAPNGTLDIYTSFVFTRNLLSTTGHINTVLLLDTTIASAPSPGTAFLRFHPLPISGTLAATRVNLFNVEIGENRSMELVKQTGSVQFQDVYISSANPRTYQKFSISNPHLVTIGAYNLNGQTFSRPTQLTLK